MAGIFGAKTCKSMNLFSDHNIYAIDPAFFNYPQLMPPNRGNVSLHFSNICDWFLFITDFYLFINQSPITFGESKLLEDFSRLIIYFSRLINCGKVFSFSATDKISRVKVHSRMSFILVVYTIQILTRSAGHRSDETIYYQIKKR